MKINQKMEDYLIEQVEKLDEAVLEMGFSISGNNNPGLRKQWTDVRQLTNYLKHALTESSTCEHCKEIGLVD